MKQKWRDMTRRDVPYGSERATRVCDVAVMPVTSVNRVQAVLAWAVSVRGPGSIAFEGPAEVCETPGMSVAYRQMNGDPECGLLSPRTRFSET